MQEHAVDRLNQHRRAIALLAENVASGRPNAYVEHFCGCCLDGAMAWHHDLPHGGRLAFLEADHWARLHQAKQVGDSRHLVDEPSRGNSVAPWARPSVWPSSRRRWRTSRPAGRRRTQPRPSSNSGNYRAG